MKGGAFGASFEINDLIMRRCGYIQAAFLDHTPEGPDNCEEGVESAMFRNRCQKAKTGRGMKLFMGILRSEMMSGEVNKILG